MNEFIAFEPKGPCGNDQVGADRKRQQASPPHVKDWLKREEILSLFATGSQAVALTPPQVYLGGVFVLAHL